MTNCDVSKCRCDCHVDDQIIQNPVSKSGIKAPILKKITENVVSNSSPEKSNITNPQNNRQSIIKLSSADNNIEVEEDISPTKKFAMKFAMRKKQSLEAANHKRSSSQGDIPGSFLEKFNANNQGNFESPTRNYVNGETPSTPYDDNKQESPTRRNSKYEISNDDKEYILKMEMKANKEKEGNKNNAVKKLLSKYSPVVFQDQLTQDEKARMGLTSEYNFQQLSKSSSAVKEKSITSRIAKSNIYLITFI